MAFPGIKHLFLNTLLLVIFFILGSCSAIENNATHNEFKSIQPDYTNIETKTSLEGTIYEGSGGLFASDRRANNLGDIITITLDETITANNNGSGTLNNPPSSNQVAGSDFTLIELNSAIPSSSWSYLT